MGSKFYIKTVPGERVEASLTIPAGQESVLAGTVTNAAGEPAAGAVLLVMDEAGRQTLGQCVTDAEGFFLLGPLPGGVLCQVRVAAPAHPVRIVQLHL